MKIDVHYDRGCVSLQVPDDNIECVIRPWQDESGADNAAILRQAVNSQEAAAFAQQIAGKRVCVLVEDGTRDTPREDIFGRAFSLLRDTAAVRFIISTGTHDADTPENGQIRQHIEKAASSAGLSNNKIHTHDCEKDNLINAGRTSRGTQILFNAEADEADVFLVLSDMKCHYFAGYSNPIKNFVPGICAFETTEHNHSLALDDRSTFGRHPWHSDPARRSNPIAQEQLEGMRLIVKGRPVYVLGTISTARQIQWARFGLIEQVAREAFDKIDERNTHTVKPVSRLIVSPGGFPNDTDLYIAQRALELTKNVVTDDGQILFLAACRNGVGDAKTMEHFYNLLKLPLERVLESIESEYKLYSHKPYKFARLIMRLQKIWMHSELADDIVEAAHLYPAHDPQGIVESWLKEDPAAKIIVVDGANKIALYASQ